MNATVKHTSADPDPASFTISAFFSKEEAVQDVMWECLHRGVPRDLIDVAVSPGAAPHFFGGRTLSHRDSWFSWAGRGALAGLLLTALVSLGIVLLPGFNATGFMAIVQFLGPDIGVIAGGALGAMYGYLKPGDVTPQLLRARERADAALMLVHLQPEEEAQAIRGIFELHGGEAIRVDADTANSVGSE